METSETWFLEVLLWILKESVVTGSVGVIWSVLESLDEATQGKERKLDVAEVWENVLRDLWDRRRKRRIGMGRNNCSVFFVLRFPKGQ